MTAAALSAFATFLSAVVAGFAFFAAWKSARASERSAHAARAAREGHLYDLARGAHQDLTTGEVSAARDRLGTLSRLRGSPEETLARVDAVLAADNGGERAGGEAGRATPQTYARDRRRDWFTLLWSLQRVHAVKEILDRQQTDHPEPSAFLNKLLTPIIRFLNDESENSRGAIEELLSEWIDDQDSKEAGFIPLVEKLVVPSRHRIARLADSRQGQPAPKWGRWVLPITAPRGTSLYAELMKRLREEERDERHVQHGWDSA